jgi:hypothetical protein
MGKIIAIDEHFQHFRAELKEGFWGDLYAQTRQSLATEIPGGCKNCQFRLGEVEDEH